MWNVEEVDSNAALNNRRVKDRAVVDEHAVCPDSAVFLRYCRWYYREEDDSMLNDCWGKWEGNRQTRG